MYNNDYDPMLEAGEHGYGGWNVVYDIDPIRDRLVNKITVVSDLGGVDSPQDGQIVVISGTYEMYVRSGGAWNLLT